MSKIFKLILITLLSSCSNAQVNDKIIQESSKTLEIKFYKYSEIEVVGLLYRIIEAGLPPTNINRISKEEYGIPYENVEVKLLIDREDFQRYEIFYRQWLYTPWDRTKALELFPQTAHLIYILTTSLNFQ